MFRRNIDGVIFSMVPISRIMLEWTFVNFCKYGNVKKTHASRTNKIVNRRIDFFSTQQHKARNRAQKRLLINTHFFRYWKTKYKNHHTKYTEKNPCLRKRPIFRMQIKVTSML